MAKRSIETELSDLAALAKHPDDPQAQQKLAAALASRTSFVAARAAGIVGEFQLKTLNVELIAAFDRFLNDSKLTDKGCTAKIAIARTLYEMGEPMAEGVFLAGIKHVQMEGSFGPPVDVAAELRGYCALGLVRLGYRHVMSHLVDLLNDPTPQARSFAARALAYSERDDAAMLLRFKLLVGDPVIDVTNECLSALARIRQPDLVEFLSRFLVNDESDIRISAALALGETRLADALEALRDHHPRERDPDVRRAILLATATLRLPAALDWLVHLIESANVADAGDAIEALGMYRRDQTIAARVTAAGKARKEPEIARAISRHIAAG